MAVAKSVRAGDLTHHTELFQEGHHHASGDGPFAFSDGKTPAVSDMRIYGQHDEATIKQLARCVAAEPGAPGVLCADGHKGYSMPIGGVVGYQRFVSPSGVGYDIACGNMAVRTNLTARDLS